MARMPNMQTIIRELSKKSSSSYGSGGSSKGPSGGNEGPLGSLATLGE